MSQLSTIKKKIKNLDVKNLVMMKRYPLMLRSSFCSLLLLFLLLLSSPPAVYPDGRVCISILHAPGDDPMGYESSAERWSPVQSVEKILLSVVSMLAGTTPSSHDSSHASAHGLLPGCIDWLIQDFKDRSLFPRLFPCLLSSQSRMMRAERTSTPLRCGVRTESSSTNSLRRLYVSL